MPAPVGEPDAARAAELFDRQCALCHGFDGLGDGPAALMLFPPARDFSAGRFRLVSTDNGVPTQADLVRTLRRGMPGSSMPSFAWMSDEDLEGLAEYVRWLAVEGTTERIVSAARAGGGEVERSAAHEVAEERFLPGEQLTICTVAPDDGEIRAEGRRLYEQSCAYCHGQDGAGLDDRPAWDEDGTLNWARDFTSGILKGAGTAEALGWRIQAGMPGTAMPGTSFEPDQLAALVAYLQSLIPPDAVDALVLERSTLSAPRVEGEVPTRAADRRWESAPSIEVRLTPLWWRRDSILSASLSALHDGERIAIRVRWQDATQDDSTQGSYPFGDAVAVQLSADPEPNLFGMGAAGHPVDQWHWRAFTLSSMAGWMDLLGDAAHRAREVAPDGSSSDVPRYVPALPAEGVVEERTAAGLDATVTHETSSAVQADARWNQDRWEVVFTRTLDAPMPKAVALEVGAPVQVALAIWNGAAGDLRGQKSISIWQELELEP